MPIVKLTARSVARLKPPDLGQIDYFDDSLPGFGLRVSAGGRRAWVLLYRHGTLKRRLTLGPYPDLPLAAARDKAKDHLREVAHGRDPAAEKVAGRKAETFAELAEDYLERYAKKRKRSWRKDELTLARDLLPRFATEKAKAISRRDINRLLDSIMDRGAPIQANRTFEILRRIFNWGIERDIVAVNPCQGIRAPGEEKARDRVLTPDELRAVWNALAPEQAQIAAMFKLRILTAQRGGEVSTIRRSALDLQSAWWTIPGELSKNGLAHRVPLAPQVVEIVKEALRSAGDDECLFPSPTSDGPVRSIWRAVARIRKRSGVEFRPHDLRRTAASLMTGMGISRLTVSKILNHAESDITAVYDRHSYDAEKRQALEAWAVRVEQIVTGRTADADKVVPLRRGAMRTMDLGAIDKDDWSRLPVVSSGVAVSACRLVAYMYWPDHEGDRNRYLALLVAKARGAVSAWKAAEETTAGADTAALYAAISSTTCWLGSQLEGLGGFTLFTSGPSLEGCTQAVALAARPGNIAGRILLAARAVHFRFAGSSKSTSISRAVDLVRRVNQYRTTEIWEAWAAYKSVAHLFAANILLHANPAPAPLRSSDGGFSVFAGLPCVLKVAQELQDFGLSAVPTGRQTPLLDPGHTWRVPYFPAPEGVSLLDTPSISDDIRRQIDAYRARPRPVSTP